MTKRTNLEIEKDYKAIRKLVETKPVTSFTEIAEELSLSLSEIRTSLSKHPKVQEKIALQMEENKAKLKGKSTAEEQPETNTCPAGSLFVIDASFAGTSDFENKVSDILSSDGKIVLTSVSIKEFEKMQNFHDGLAVNSRHILSMAAEKPADFVSVLIDESLDTADDCIVKYCADNKDRVTLLTADKTMTLKARMFGVQTEYFKQDRQLHSNFKVPHYDSNCNTLPVARKVGNKLIVSIFSHSNRSIMILSNGVEHTSGSFELSIGDNVYVATKRHNYTHFEHFRVTSLSERNNCRLIYSTHIYNWTQINNLPKAVYKAFMRDFKRLQFSYLENFS